MGKGRKYGERGTVIGHWEIMEILAGRKGGVGGGGR